ncbi:MAG: DUF4347 domain-containing protein, partial [Bradymonadia bacterium]
MMVRGFVLLISLLCVSNSAVASPIKTHEKSLAVFDQDHHLAALAEGSQLTYTTLPGQEHPVIELTALIHREGVNELHVVAHGVPGSFDLNGVPISLDEVEHFKDLIASWRLNEMYLWSCRVGAHSGLVERLRELTGAEVWSSGRLVGSVGGELQWALESPLPYTPNAP